MGQVFDLRHSQFAIRGGASREKAPVPNRPSYKRRKPLRNQELRENADEQTNPKQTQLQTRPQKPARPAAICSEPCRAISILRILHCPQSSTTRRDLSAFLLSTFPPRPRRTTRVLASSQGGTVVPHPPQCSPLENPENISSSVVDRMRLGIALPSPESRAHYASCMSPAASPIVSESVGCG